MSDNYIIEIRPNGMGITVQAGIVIRDGDRFRFFSATHAFNALEGLLFKSPKDASKAALRQVTVLTTQKPPGWVASGGGTRQNTASSQLG